ncbi:MAG TPA: hypothetical protein VFE15_08070 [Marmoricola sp.]|jgi:hypothetical protein|nr:hypothetical protein [Marmoricola sp.]
MKDSKGNVNIKITKAVNKVKPQVIENALTKASRSRIRPTSTPPSPGAPTVTSPSPPGTDSSPRVVSDGGGQLNWSYARAK